ncbi:MAG: universal stress protein [Anaerolineae bacterium]|nr:universal stress protein [Anaerolineae bacterium]
MAGDGEEKIIQRILVALDASTDSLAALEAAAKLAARLQAELVGLFVEDINLLRLAGLPFTREWRFPTLGDVTHEQMETALRLQASQARRALSNAAEPRSVRWSFKVVRGQVTPELLAAALEADLIILGKASRPLSRHTRLGSTARALATQAPHSVWLTHHLAVENRPILVTFDGSAVGKQAVQVASYLALALQLPLTVFLLGDVPDEVANLVAAAAAWLSHPPEQPLTIRTIHLPQPEINSLVEAIRREGGGTLVLGGAASPLQQAETIQILLDSLDCPVLLVR